MITTKRFSWSDDSNVGLSVQWGREFQKALGVQRDLEAQKALEERGWVAQTDTLSLLRELVEFWLCLGGRVIGVGCNQIILKLWLLDHYHIAKFDGSKEEIHPLLKAAFAFAKAGEVVLESEDDHSFPVSSSDFYDFLDNREIVEITDAVWKYRILLMNARWRSKFAFLIGAGVSRKDKLNPVIQVMNLDDGMEEFFRVVTFAGGKKSVGRVLKEEIEMKERVTKRPAWQWLRRRFKACFARMRFWRK